MLVNVTQLALELFKDYKSAWDIAALITDQIGPAWYEGNKFHPGHQVHDRIYQHDRSLRTSSKFEAIKTAAGRALYTQFKPQAVAKKEAATRIYDIDTPLPPAEDQLRIEVAQLKTVNGRLFNQLIAAKARNEDLVAATIEAARDAALSYGPIGPTSRPHIDNRPKDNEAAIWHLTDWQGAKVTTSYNSEVMRERVMRFCHKAELITAIQRADHPVREVHLLLGGDMGEGLFNYPTQPYEVDATLFGQFVTVSSLIVDVAQYALSIYDEVWVNAEWGNHGRIGSKRDAVPRSDNFDRMIYEHARQLLAGEPRLHWEDCPEDIQRVEVGNYKALLIHGDEVGRTGYASPTTIAQHVNRWRSGAYPWDFRDVYVGHYHTHMELPLANGIGAVYWTGSTESDNRYALETMAASATPTQRLHFIDKERGRVSAQYKIYVDKD